MMECKSTSFYDVSQEYVISGIPTWDGSVDDFSDRRTEQTIVFMQRAAVNGQKVLGFFYWIPGNVHANKLNDFIVRELEARNWLTSRLRPAHSDGVFIPLRQHGNGDLMVLLPRRHWSY